MKYRVFGSDNNGRALSTARQNIELAGLSDIFVQKLPMNEVRSRFDCGKIITNPPYGERLSEQKEVEKLYNEMGTTFRENFYNWHYYILSSQPDFETHFDDKSTKNRKLYNGGIKCWYYQFF